MTSPAAPGFTWADFTATAKVAQHILPGTPRQEVVLLGEQRSYQFEMDNDLIKLVTLAQSAAGLAIRVRYATDVLIGDHQYSLAVPKDAVLRIDGFGVVVTWRTPLIPGLAWPMITRKRRF